MTSSTHEIGAQAQMGSENQSNQYEFFGRHLLVSYSQCDVASLTDSSLLLREMNRALTTAHATIIDSTFHVFPNGGFTAVFMLAQSHASIHTYPEHGSCFVDFFTCGQECDPDSFDSVLQSCLKPKTTEKKLLSRHTGIE